MANVLVVSYQHSEERALYTDNYQVITEVNEGDRAGFINAADNAATKGYAAYFNAETKQPLSSYDEAEQALGIHGYRE